MNPDDHKYVRVKKMSLIIIALIVVAGLVGWLLGRSDDPKPTTNQTPSSQNTSQPPSSAGSNSSSDVKSLVSYTLPDGWKEATCPNATGAVFVIPSGASGVNCDANPSSPVKISVDPANNTDCNQLQNVQNVSKHVCVSEFINGKKSLKAETAYNKDSSYKKETAINAYYINTGKGVVKVEYIHDPSSNDYQAGFEQLAKSIQVK